MQFYTIEEFQQEMEESLPAFVENMKRLNIEERRFPDWYTTFAAWLEVGTDQEEFVWGNSLGYQLDERFNEPDVVKGKK